MSWTTPEGPTLHKQKAPNHVLIMETELFESPPAPARQGPRCSHCETRDLGRALVCVTMTTPVPQTGTGGRKTETTRPKSKAVRSGLVSPRLALRQEQAFRHLKIQTSWPCPSWHIPSPACQGGLFLCLLSRACSIGGHRALPRVPSPCTAPADSGPWTLNHRLLTGHESAPVSGPTGGHWDLLFLPNTFIPPREKEALCSAAFLPAGPRLEGCRLPSEALSWAGPSLSPGLCSRVTRTEHPRGEVSRRD